MEPHTLVARLQWLTVPTSEAIRALQAEPKETNAILHVTCDPLRTGLSVVGEPRDTTGRGRHPSRAG